MSSHDAATAMLLIDALYHGRFDTAFPDPVDAHEFEEWLAAHAAQHDGGCVRFTFTDDDDDEWCVWLVLTGDDRAGLYLPTEDAPDRLARPDVVPEDWPVYDYAWPEGLG